MRSVILAAVLLALLCGRSAAQTWENIFLPWGVTLRAIDLEGSTVWMTTQQLPGGDDVAPLIRYDGSSWRRYHRDNSGLRDNNWNVVLLVDRAGDKWVVRDVAWDNYKTVDRLDDAGATESWAYYDRAQEITSRRVLSIAEDCSGNKWFGIRDENGGQGTTVELLVENDPDTTGDDEWFAYDNTATPDSTSFSTDRVTALAVDEACRLWIGGFASGVDVWDYGNPRTFADDRWEHYTDVHGLPSNRILTLETAPDGRVWAGTTDGLAVFDPVDDSWKAHGGLPGIQARAIDFDARGHVWVGTENGVAVLYSNGRVLATYGVIDGIKDEEIVDLTVDRSKGTVWAIAVDEAGEFTSLNVFESEFTPFTGGIFAYPNPWRAWEATKSMEEAITLVGVPEGSTVRILDLAGEEIRELAPTEPYTWDTLDASLNEVPSGLYVMRVETPEERVEFLKVAIVR